LNGLRWIAVALTAFGAFGCSTIPPTAELAATTTAFAYSTGRGLQAYATTPSMVIEALNNAMSDLSMTQIKVTRDGAVSRVDARTHDNRQIAAIVRSHQGTTHVAVRVGWFGDMPLSLALLERVDMRLGNRPSEVIPETPPSDPSPNPYFSRAAVSDAEMLGDFMEAPYRDRVVP
jgi:hypothetical protein